MFRRCIFIEYETNKYDYRFWDPQNRKIFRHKDVIFNKQKTYKDLQTEGAPRRIISGGISEHSRAEGVADSEFVELENAPVNKA